MRVARVERKSLRDRLVERGLITPSQEALRPYERPLMLESARIALKDKYLREGLIIPKGWRH